MTSFFRNRVVPAARTTIVSLLARFPRGRRLINGLRERRAIQHAAALVSDTGTEAQSARIAELLGQSDSADPAVLFNLAGQLAHRGLYSKSIDVLNRCTSVQPDHLLAWLTLAQVLAHEARYREALEACQRALRIDPGSSAAVASMQQILPALAAGEDIAEAREDLIQACRAILKMKPDDVESWLNLGAGLDAKSREAEPQAPIAALQHAEAGAQTGIATPIARREAPEIVVRRLIDDESAINLSDLAGYVSTFEDSNTALARLISAQHERLGYLDSLENWARYEHTKIYFRNLGLYTRKYGLRGALEEPRQSIPEELLPRFTMDGRVTIEQGCLNFGYPAEAADAITDHDLQGFAFYLTKTYPEFAEDRRGELATAAEAKSAFFANVLAQRAYGFRRVEHDRLRRAFAGQDMSGSQVAVVTMLGLWIEALCLLSGAKPTRISPIPVVSQTPLLPCMTIADWELGKPTFDQVVAYNVVEHRGLGRLGEPIDPDADRLLLQQLAAMLRPGGLLWLFLPIGKDTVVFNAGRIYGRARLPHLLEGWRVIDAPGFAETTLDGTGEQVTLLALQRY